MAALLPVIYYEVAAVQYAYKQLALLKMSYPVIIYTHHKVSELLE